MQVYEGAEKGKRKQRTKRNTCFFVELSLHFSFAKRKPVLSEKGIEMGIRSSFNKLFLPKKKF